MKSSTLKWGTWLMLPCLILIYLVPKTHSFALGLTLIALAAGFATATCYCLFTLLWRALKTPIEKLKKEK